MRKKDIGGIYKITCLGNNVIYIESTNDFIKRRAKHLRTLKGKKHCNSKM